MSNKQNKILVAFAVLIFAISQFSGASVLGQDSNSNYTNTEINRLNQQIQDKKNFTKKIKAKQQEYTDAIKEKQSEKATLGNQLALLDNRSAKTELDIEKVEVEIDRMKLEIKKTGVEIREKNKNIEREKSHVADVLRLMDQKDKVSSLEVILMNNSLADFLSQVKYLEDVSKNLDESLNNLEKLKQRLEKEKEELNAQNEDLNTKREKLVEEHKKLAQEADEKTTILSLVGASEKEYQRLLAKAKTEQHNAAAEIVSMEKLMRAKIAKMDGKKLNVNDDGMIWPVPKNVITTYFHDPDYPFRYIFEHPAVDIRAAQGTTLRAAESGYVARVKDGGLGYSYIMIVHADGLSTVYGHVSKIYVKEDDYVVQGQRIGLTGGMPGSPGAGRLTTGPHLHFEVRLNGIPVDPLGYLP